MVEPISEGPESGLLAAIVQRLPGYRGYRLRRDRQQSDEQSRAWLVERLERGKRGLDAHTRRLVDDGRIDELPGWEQLRTRLDRLAARIASSWHGYRSFFDRSDLVADRLEDVYDCDARLQDETEKLLALINATGSATEAAAEPAAAIRFQLDQVQATVDERETLLKQLSADG